jgi:hypothetical protein
MRDEISNTHLRGRSLGGVIVHALEEGMKRLSGVTVVDEPFTVHVWGSDKGRLGAPIVKVPLTERVERLAGISQSPGKPAVDGRRSCCRGGRGGRRCEFLAIGETEPALICHKCPMGVADTWSTEN